MQTEIRRQAAHPQVLVIAPGKNGRGGIDSVVRLHQSTSLWPDMCCILSTYDDRSACRKILASVRAYALSPVAMLRVQIVHFHLAGEISLLRKIPLLALASALRRRVILHIHASSEDSLFYKTPHWAWTFAFRSAHCVIALSPTWAMTIRHHTLHPRVVVMSNPVRLFSSAASTNVRPPRILYVGKLEVRKGFGALIEAAALVQRQHPQAEFWFAGHGELQQAELQVKQLGLQGCVRLLGWISGEELQSIYEQVDLFCLPSFNEGVPMSVLEAMSHGLPVICTPVGGLPDLVQDGRNGIFVEPGNATSIALAILRLLADPELAAAVACAGRETVRALCSLDSVAEQLANLYRDLGATSAITAGAHHGT